MARASDGSSVRRKLSTASVYSPGVPSSASIAACDFATGRVSTRTPSDVAFAANLVAAGHESRRSDEHTSSIGRAPAARWCDGDASRQ